jgi:hypothetical protein
MRVGRPQVQRDPASATASAPAGIRIGLDGSFTARHTAHEVGIGLVVEAMHAGVRDGLLAPARSGCRGVAPRERGWI